MRPLRLVSSLAHLRRRRRQAGEFIHAAYRLAAATLPGVRRGRRRLRSPSAIYPTSTPIDLPRLGEGERLLAPTTGGRRCSIRSGR